VTDEPCPYCLRPFSEGGGANKEHVIGEAFGSRSTVPSCVQCNSKWCGTIEAPIHGRASVLDLIKMAAGTGTVRGTTVLEGMSEPVKVTVDADGQPRLDHPVVEIDVVGDKITGRLLFPEGTPAQEMVDAVYKALERRGVAPAPAQLAAEQLVRQAKVTSQPITVNSALTARIDLLQRHAAKVTIAASVKAAIPIDSDFTNAVRKILDSEDGEPFEAPSAELNDQVRATNSKRGGSPPAATDGLPAAQVTMTRVGEMILVDVHLLGLPHPAGPYVVHAPIPDLADGDAILVREDGRPLRVQTLHDSNG
jgi:hypothetical protein